MSGISGPDWRSFHGFDLACLLWVGPFPGSTFVERQEIGMSTVSYCHSYPNNRFLWVTSIQPLSSVTFTHKHTFMGCWPLGDTVGTSHSTDDQRLSARIGWSPLWRTFLWLTTVHVHFESSVPDCVTFLGDDWIVETHGPRWSWSLQNTDVG